jgi:hypothetical protein
MTFQDQSVAPSRSDPQVRLAQLTHAFTASRVSRRMRKTDDVAAYAPNWTNPQVRRRAQTVLSYVDLFMSPSRATELSAADLTEAFGNQSNPLSAFLRDMLLVEASGSYKIGHYAKLWKLDRFGRDKLTRQLDIANNGNGALGGELEAQRSSFVMEKYGDELATLTFEYHDTSHRLFHGLQNIKREHKSAFWMEHGLPWNYDIAACAPTILFQLAERYLKGHQASDQLVNLLFGTLQEYLQDRSTFRQHVADITGMSLNNAKRLINSLFNGARLARSAQCSAYQLMDFDYDAMTRLQHDPQVQRLRDDIGRMWRRIEDAKRFAPPLSNGVDKWKLRNSKDKWGVYFENERAVLDVIRDYLHGTGNRVFTEHDGFRTERQIDVGELQAKIESESDLKLKIEQG